MAFNTEEFNQASSGLCEVPRLPLRRVHAVVFAAIITKAVHLKAVSARAVRTLAAEQKEEPLPDITPSSGS